MLLCQLKAISEHISRMASPRRHLANSSRVKEMGSNQSEEVLRLRLIQVRHQGKRKRIVIVFQYLSSVRLPTLGKN